MQPPKKKRLMRITLICGFSYAFFSAAVCFFTVEHLYKCAGLPASLPVEGHDLTILEVGQCPAYRTFLEQFTLLAILWKFVLLLS